MANILIVDGVAANRTAVAALLSGQDHTLFQAGNGEAALTLARENVPGLVVTDLLMPVMDGHEFITQLRSESATRGTPVIFYTPTYGEREARALSRSLGNSYTVTKPADSARLLAVINVALAGGIDATTPGEVDERAKDVQREHLRLVTKELTETGVDLRHANARLRALINIGLDLAEELDPDRLLRRVCVAARDLFGATYVTLGIVTLDDRKVERITTSGEDIGDAIKAGDSIAGLLATVVSERRSVRGDNPGGDPTQIALPERHPVVQTFLAAPVASPNQVYGWFCLVGNEGRAFTEDDEDLVTALSGQIGRIYETTHYYAVAQKRTLEAQRETADRRDAETALRDSEARTRFALESAGVGIWDMNYVTGVLQWSDLLEAQYGLTPGTFEGTLDGFLARVHPDDRESLRATLASASKSGLDFTTQHRAIRPDGNVRSLRGAGRVHLDERGKPARGVGISLDFTDRVALDEQYRQAQKMEAIGRLAGGVAHDFNNLLTVILGYCELLLADIGVEDPRQAYITEIHGAGASAAALTKQLLAFSRKQIIEPTLVCLSDVVTGIRPMLDRLIGEDITIHVILSPETANVTADRGQLEQIVLNLAVNARDAMPRGGTLTIETSNVELDDEYARMHIAVTPGLFVRLSVSDTGEGIPPDVQARLFEPFFTTKEVGKGTGLGLATVHGIVARSGGTINVYSEVGQGTLFNVYIPRAEGAAVPKPRPSRATRAVGAGELVLVIEDSDRLRDLTRRLLERQGYRVIAAANTRDAMSLWEQHDAVAVVLTDVVMPGGSGPELAARLIALRPSVKIIYMSGYTEGAIVREGILDPDVAFLHKPFTSETLGVKMREVLDEVVVEAASALAGPDLTAA